MRSFIKKLAGTMAFTMAVSAVAPAGVVFADDEAFIAMQGGDTMVADITLATGRTVDFRFVGAPADWAELDPTWTSSIPAVAEVNAAGIVTAKKAGVTTITIALSNGWTATAKVTVKDIPNDTTAPVYLAFQNTLEAVTDAHVLLNTKDGVDFWFINAPEGWQDMNPTWTSSNTDVATVDGAGIVKGIKDGFTTLTFSLNGEVVASTEITVGNPVVEEPEDPVVEDEFVVTGVDACYEGEEGYIYLDEAEFTVGDEVNLGVYYQAELKNGETVIEDYTGVYFDEFAWVSSDETIATVEDGVLTAVAAGEVTLTATGVVVDGYEETVEATITIAEAEVDNSYEVAQATDKKIVLTFADEEVAAALKKEDLTLVKVRKSGTTNFAIKEIKPNEDDKTQVFVTTYAAFGDGDTYKITVGAEDEGTEFTTTLGYVDDIEISYTSYEGETKMADGRAFANDEDEDDITVALSSKLFSGDVDVTSAAGYEPETVEYSIEGEYDEENVDLYEGILTFYKAGVVVTVKATYTYEDANGDEKTEEAFIDITSEAKPAYEIVGVKDWAFIKDGQDKIDWSVKDVRAGDEDMYIVALIEDSYGNIFVTDKDYAKKTNSDYPYIEDGKFGDEGYDVLFSSTDVSKVVVDGSEIKTWDKVANAGILISLYNDNTETTEDIYCAEFKVKEVRKLNKATVDKDNIKILVGGNCTTETFTIKLFDQDDKAWADVESVKLVATTTVGRDKKKSDPYYATQKKNSEDKWVTGEYTFDVTSTDVAKALGMYTVNDKGEQVLSASKFDVKYTIEVVDKGVTTSFDVDLVATDGTNFNYETETEHETISTTLATDTKDPEKTNKISFYSYQRGAKFGLVSVGAEKEEPKAIKVLATSGAFNDIKDMKKAEGDVQVGSRFFVVYKPDGSILNKYEADKDAPYGIKEVYNEKGELEFEVVLTTTIASGNALKVVEAPAGTYKAKVLEIKDFKKTGVSFKEYEVKFKVTNDTPKATFATQDKLVSDAIGTKNIILDALSFNLGDGAWSETDGWRKLTANDIINKETEKEDGTVVYDGIIETEDYIVVKYLDVKVRVSKELVGENDDIYYQQRIEVNKTIQKAK